MENYGTMEKSRYYEQNYGTIPRTMELRFTKEKNMLDYGTILKTMEL